MDETELIRQMQNGDMDAFDQIFIIYKDKLLRMAFLISGNYADSEDIVQESFVKCYCYRKNLKDVSSFSSWLYQILTHTAWRFCKKKRREQPSEEVFAVEQPSVDPQPLDHVIHIEERSNLYKQIKQLEIRQKTTIVLYYFNQLSTREIARIMGCREGTVKSRLHTARKNLEKAISDDCFYKEEELSWKTKSLIL